MSRPLPSLLAVAAGAILLAGCGRAVGVDPLPIRDADVRAACAALIDALPDEISAGRQWPVEPDPASTRAWGSPPVVLRCGQDAPRPGPTDQLLEVDGLTWLVTPLTDGEQYTSVDRQPSTVLSVPSDHAPTASVLTEIGPAVAQHSSAGG